MSDSIYIKNSVFNDSDLLSSSSSLQVKGVLDTPLVVNTFFTEFANVKSQDRIEKIFTKICSCEVMENKAEPLKPLSVKSTFIHPLKDVIRTYVTSSSTSPLKRILKMDTIGIEVVSDVYINHSEGSESIAYTKNTYKKEKQIMECGVTSLFVKPIQTINLDTNIISTNVLIGEKLAEQGYINVPIISVDVNNDYPTAEGPLGGASGGDLEKMVFTIQQMSFFEFRFYFKSNKVVNVFNLPSGMHFDKLKQRMYGTPTLSGRYPINIILEDESNVQGIIDVPKLYREL